MTEQTKKKIDKIDTVTKYINRLVFTGLAAVMGVFCISYYNKAGEVIDTWVHVPETVKAVKAQPYIDSVQDCRTAKLRQAQDSNHNVIVVMFQEIRTVSQSQTHSINQIAKKLDLPPVFIPEDRAELSPKVR